MKTKLGLLFLFVSAIAYGAGKDMLGPFPLITSQALSSSATTTSTVVNIRGFDNIGVQFNTPTTTATGSFFVDVSEDYNANTNTAGNWVTLPLSPAPTVASAAATAFYQDINQSGAPYMRVRYVPTTTGAGVFAVFFSGKME